MPIAVVHRSFTIERTYTAPAAKVFRAIAEADSKRRWFAEGEGFIVDHFSLDFRVGGFERSRFRHVSGPPMTFDSVFMDILPDRRIVYAYGMTIDGAPLSSSLGTIELIDVVGGTLLRYTEHTAFLDGNDMCAGRREGSIHLLEALAREVERLG